VPAYKSTSKAIDSEGGIIHFSTTPNNGMQPPAPIMRRAPRLMPEAFGHAQNSFARLEIGAG
jgi:hypothetical protein